MWRHSVAAALAAELASLVCTARILPESFTAALLHDIGHLVLSRHLEPELIAFLGSSRDKGGFDERRAEIEILGVHHGELGHLIAQHWALPEIIAQGIAFHHNPEDVTDPKHQLLCDTVCVADAVANAIGFGLGKSEEALSDCSASRGRIGLTDQGFEDLCALASDRVQGVLAWYE